MKQATGTLPSIGPFNRVKLKQPKRATTLFLPQQRNNGRCVRLVPCGVNELSALDSLATLMRSFPARADMGR
jgi:hypothetical protein